MKENKLIETGVGPFLKKIEKRVIKRNKELLNERKSYKKKDGERENEWILL